ncbi:dihydrofolate reductase [Prevotella sp. HMSC077E09]|uniref:dipeptidyl-peptidase 3 family protein n=1 Tax=Prevotella sp. HMSC077E09 TaxID=1739487 RepID=UPI0008A1EE21|nr:MULTISPECIES: dihydrofolate reductase [unclassified Prevotella]OFO84322.1 dihydrofolate reductase [Prevotella sp. HMSC077E08]OFP58863.1 dihydrofolate reductase [Prevotella sp. HMSC077E09]
MNYIDEKFADIQLLRYKLEGFEALRLQQKIYIYYLSKAVLSGRDITFDQFGKYNLSIRKVLESIFLLYNGSRDTHDFQALTVYLKRVWFSNGIYHHYGCDKFKPEFSRDFFCDAYNSLSYEQLALGSEEEKNNLLNEILPVIFDADYLPKRVNKAEGVDLIKTSACNFYEDVSQSEVESFYNGMKVEGDARPVSYGLNSKLTKQNGKLTELVYKANGMYGNKIRQIIHWLTKASQYAENEQQKKVIAILIKFYQTGDLKHFDEYSIEWLKEQEGQVDFINGFIEVYGDPLGLKGSWEGIVEYKDAEATKRTRLISENAQWFEDHSPVDRRFKKKTVRGVTANVICAAMLGGDEYPSTAIGINLPNADWIRAEHGSKSVTIGNLTDAYSKASRGNGFMQEFVIDDETRALIDRYGDLCDELHTDLHECLGHGSGQLLKETDPDALKAYGNTIEEARADLFGLYYLADDKLVELGLTPDREAYKSQYYTYMQNGLLTQAVRIELGNDIEEAHMRNRALIANWALDMDVEQQIVALEMHGGKHYVSVKDYEGLRGIFACQLGEIQRIKSEGDFNAARALVEKYAVHIDSQLHREILERYEKLGIAPYKGFLNPWMKPEYDENGNIVNIKLDYTESYVHQMMRYSSEY